MILFSRKTEIIVTVWALTQLSSVPWLDLWTDRVTACIGVCHSVILDTTYLWGQQHNVNANSLCSSVVCEDAYASQYS